MSHQNRPNLPRLVVKIRNRLWLKNIVALLDWGMWAAAFVLFAAGIIHSWVRPLPWTAAAAFAATTVVFSIAVGILLRRPCLRTAAVAADRSFGTQELFISAFEQTLMPREVRRGASGFVQKQAEMAAAYALKSNDGRERLLKGGQLLAPVVALFGLFLVLGPAGEHSISAKTGQDEGAPKPRLLSRSDIEEAPMSRLRGEIEVFRRKLARTRQDPVQPPAGPGIGAEIRPPLQAGAMSDQRSLENEHSPLDVGRLPSPARAGDNVPVRPGDGVQARAVVPDRIPGIGVAGEVGAGHGLDRNPGPGMTAVIPELSILPADISRDPGNMAGLRAVPLLTNQSIHVPQQPDRNDPVGAAVAGEGGWEMIFSPAARAYAQAYFEMLRKSQ